MAEYTQHIKRRHCRPVGEIHDQIVSSTLRKGVGRVEEVINIPSLGILRRKSGFNCMSEGAYPSPEVIGDALRPPFLVSLKTKNVRTKLVLVFVRVSTSTSMLVCFIQNGVRNRWVPG